MTPKQFATWMMRVYDTRENEWDCDQTQPLLAVYAEAEFHGNFFAESANVEVHLRHCASCLETFKQLYDLVEIEAEEGELPAVPLEAQTPLPTLHAVPTSGEFLPLSAD